MIIAFKRLAKCGTQVLVDREVHYAFSVCNKQQRKMGLDLYVTPKDDAKFLKDNSINLLGRWSDNLPSINDDDCSILFTLKFGTVEIKDTAFNNDTGVIHETYFDLDL